MKKLTLFSLSILLLFLFQGAIGVLAFGQSPVAEKVPSEKPTHERIEWTDIWVTNANNNDLPRVLLVGDSIVKGYFGPVQKELANTTNCARYATSAFIGHQDYLDGLKIVLDRYHFDVIHINNGLHGPTYSDAQYRAGFEKLAAMLKEHAQEATIIWATTTPVRQRGALDKLNVHSTDQVKRRNTIAIELAKKNGYQISDLFSLVIDHPEYFRGDGVHYNAKGTSAQGKFVAQKIAAALKKTKGDASKTPKRIEYSNDFESSVQDWEFVDQAGWKIAADGKNHLLSLFKKKSEYRPKVRSPLHIALLKEKVVGDFQMDVKVRSTHPDYGHRDVCFFFGYQSPTKFYYAHLAKQKDDHANQIFLVNDKDRVKISATTTKGTPWDDKWHHVRVIRSIKQGTIQLFFDDMQKPIMTAKDRTLLTGRVGLGSFDDTADFDDFMLQGEIVATPVLTATQKEKEAGPLPVTVRPVARAAAWWQNRHKAMNKRVQQGKVDLVFIGDSITHSWEGQGKAVWNTYYKKRNAVNLGISGDRTEHVLWRLQNGNLKGISPKLAVIMIGTNNSGDDSPEDIALGVKAILNTIKEKTPQTKILLLGIFPRGADAADKRRLVNEKANRIIATFADNKRSFYMDIGEKFLAKDGKLPRSIMPDLLHPNAKGYEIWASAIEKKIEALMQN